MELYNQIHVTNCKKGFMIGWGMNKKKKWVLFTEGAGIKRKYK